MHLLVSLWVRNMHIISTGTVRLASSWLSLRHFTSFVSLELSFIRFKKHFLGIVAKWCRKFKFHSIVIANTVLLMRTDNIIVISWTVNLWNAFYLEFNMHFHLSTKLITIVFGHEPLIFHFFSYLFLNFDSLQRQVIDLRILV